MNFFSPRANLTLSLISLCLFQMPGPYFDEDENNDIAYSPCDLIECHSLVFQHGENMAGYKKEKVKGERYRSSWMPPEIPPDRQLLIPLFLFSKDSHIQADGNTHDYHRHRSNNSHTHSCFFFIFVYFIFLQR